jgi:hypothetical protein
MIVYLMVFTWRIFKMVTLLLTLLALLVGLNLFNQLHGLPDFSMAGYHFCWFHGNFGRLRGFFRIHWSHGDEFFHNGITFIPGTQICFLGLGLQISQEKNWKGSPRE